MKLSIPDDTKMEELILHVAEKSADDEKFGAQKLNKILFWADFLSYLKRGKSITGQEYFALEEGPAPRRLVPIREELRQRGYLGVKRANYYGFEQERVVALRQPDYKKLEAEDVALVDFVIKKLKDKNGREVSEESHKFMGYKIAYSRGVKTTIRYASARFDVGFFGVETPSLPEVLIEHGKALHRKLAAAA